MTEPKVGQIWADNDPRHEGRTVRIDGFEHEPRYAELHAVCEVLTDSDEAARRIATGRGEFRSSVGRRTIIRADRFRPTKTGYRLVSEP